MNDDARLCHRCGYEPDDPAETFCPADGCWLVDRVEHGRAPEDPLLGTVVGAKYPIIGVIGAGGMGSVYRAIQQPVGREVAVKVIRNAAGDALQIRRRFEQEAAVVARLEHPNTVTLYDFGVHGADTL